MVRIVLVFVAVLLCVFILGFFAYITNFGLGIIAAIPGSGNTYATSYSNSIHNGILTADNDLIIGYIIMIVIICLWSYQHPSRNIALVEIVLFFLLAWLYFTYYPVFSNTANAFSFNTLIPNSYIAVSGGYFLYLTEGGLVVSAILNSRKSEEMVSNEY